MAVNQTQISARDVPGGGSAMKDKEMGSGRRGWAARLSAGAIRSLEK
jgi:hypothetical protein